MYDYNNPNMGNMYGGPQQPPQQQHPQQFQQFNGPNFQQFMPVIANQVIGDQMAQMFTQQVSQYSDNLVNQGKGWFSNKLKYYFAVDTPYVMKKLLLLFFPFAHKDWAVQFKNEQVAPKDDINAPDLYIPTMAFVTYILVAGCLLGYESKFTPQSLGILTSSALAWFIFEVIVTCIILYISDLYAALGFFHVVAFSGYKFVMMIAVLVTSFLFKNIGYYVLLAYSSASFGYFLLKSLHILFETSSISQTPGKSLRIIVFLCLAQPLLMYMLTKHLAL